MNGLSLALKSPSSEGEIQMAYSLDFLILLHTTPQNPFVLMPNLHVFISHGLTKSIVETRLTNSKEQIVGSAIHYW